MNTSKLSKNSSTREECCIYTNNQCLTPPKHGCSLNTYETVILNPEVRFLQLVDSCALHPIYIANGKRTPSFYFSPKSIKQFGFEFFMVVPTDGYSSAKHS